jgi:hypothetical protein
MTAFTGTYQTYTQIGIREELSDVIYNISPTDTPFISSAGKKSASNTTFEWQTDALAAATTDNAHIEGDDITTFPTVTPTARVGNYTQISRKLLMLSGTAEKVNKAGRKSELAYQLAMRGKEIKRDMESICLANIGGDAGGATTARQTATMGAWIKTNDVISTSGASPTYTGGVPLAARTEGTQVAFTEAMLKSAIQLVWNSGGTLKNLFVGPVNKQRVSGFTGIVTRNFDISNASPRPTAAIAAIDVYVSDFGSLKIVPNRFQRERDAWLLDFDYLELCQLRPFMVEKLAKTGDAEKRMLLIEWGLKVKQEAALGLVADLTTT